ncbi:MAG: class I SAM-dependent methyltransferase [Hydrococcus sp. Prado102]|jgi:SAM-dependent methyltransferase|nr:class I SAM-dependent methyltransferase [Hydrococcus sp. Prado102]
MTIEVSNYSWLKPSQQSYRQFRSWLSRKRKTLKTCLRHLRDRPVWMWWQLPLIMRLVEMGYYDRVLALVKFDISDLRILDLGCGTGFYGPIYLLLGAERYTGCDLKLSLKSPLAKNFRNRGEMEDMGVTPEQLMEKFKRRLFLHEGGWETLSLEIKYDLVTMNFVTEHLMDIEGAFKWVSEFLKPGGRFVFIHHNFYCWNGHHLPPRTIDDIDLTSDEQKKYLDWNHLRYQPKPTEYVAWGLNRIRLDDLKKLTETYFHIEIWKENQINKKGGLERLTPQIRESFPEYTERELTIGSVYCTVVKVN